jgi:hypothetical protein
VFCYGLARITADLKGVSVLVASRKPARTLGTSQDFHAAIRGLAGITLRARRSPAELQSAGSHSSSSGAQAVAPRSCCWLPVLQLSPFLNPGRTRPRLLSTHASCSLPSKDTQHSARYPLARLPILSLCAIDERQPFVLQTTRPTARSSNSADAKAGEKCSRRVRQGNHGHHQPSSFDCPATSEFNHQQPVCPDLHLQARCRGPLPPSRKLISSPQPLSFYLRHANPSLLHSSLPPSPGLPA